MGGAGGQRTKEREGGKCQIMWRGMAYVDFFPLELLRLDGAQTSWRASQKHRRCHGTCS